jgi:predicted O-methyltransferase YrrM
MTAMISRRAVKYEVWKLGFMLRTGAPLWSLRAYLRLGVLRRLSGRYTPDGTTHEAARDDFRRSLKDLTIDCDWFTESIPGILRAADTAGLRKREALDFLEIGSWQGVSACFFLQGFDKARLTCVDTWQGSDEHRNGDAAPPSVLATVEAAFDRNTSAFADRLTKHKGTSLSFFEASDGRERYDLIYIDGSHRSDDVIVDAVNCFKMLKAGGVLIFDDYFWTYYDPEIDNPAGAINAFLRMKRHRLEILSFDYQLIVRKLPGEVRREQA